jgi:molybdopterin molybdotransferase
VRVGLKRDRAPESAGAKEFFKVKPPAEVLSLLGEFQPVGAEEIELARALGRVLAEEVAPEVDLPPFDRSTMDGYAVQAADTFGATESVPALLSVVGEVRMGESPAFTVQRGQAASIPTGGMLPEGTDAVVMVEHTQEVAAGQIEVTRSVAPWQHVVRRGEDVPAGRVLLRPGQVLRPQEIGLLAALGRVRLRVFRRPVLAIISTGDEIVPVEAEPPPGRLRDVNSYSLSALAEQEGAIALRLGIVADSYEDLLSRCRDGLERADMVAISGGSSVGARDFTLAVIRSFEGSRLLVQGVALSPGKPTILADVSGKPLWGLPGHVASAMLVFRTLVVPLIRRLAGRTDHAGWRAPLLARLSRNVASALGREDWVRVRLRQDGEGLVAEPVLGKSGLISTLVAADGLIRIDLNSEGAYEGELVEVHLF